MREDAWLGERLGCAAWTVEPQDTPDDVLARGRGFFQAKVPAGDVARVSALEVAGFRTVDVNVMLRREAGAAAGEDAGVREATPEDRDAVAAIAERDYAVSRFHLDPEIPDTVARAIKRDWVENFFRGGRGDRMLVVERDGRVAGFNLVLDTAEAALIDLIAVAAAARRRGAGRALVCGLIRSSPGRPVLVGTQVANVEALRFYERLGFTVEQTQFVLHRHG